jgi:dienelactone hydrolase
MKHAYFSFIAACVFAVPPAMSTPIDDPGPQTWLSSVTVPELKLPLDAASWMRQRAEIRATLRTLLGDFPPRPRVPKVTILSRTDCDGYVLEKFAFDDGLGLRVPGYLFLPKNVTGRAPAILYCHWHAGQWDIGKEEMLGHNATPVPPGPTLARLGYAVMGIDACGFGERNGHGPGGPLERGGDAELSASKFSLWAGRTLWGTIVRDDLMALDYLCSRSEVDASRIGVTGISMGSTRSWWIVALDDRPKTAVCVGCMTRYQELILAGRMKEHGIYYFVPGMLQHFDTEALIACAAPRPMLFMTGDRDPGSPVEGVRALGAKVSPFYNLLGAGDSFVSLIFSNTAHIYLPEEWEKMVAWMGQRLK